MYVSEKEFVSTPTKWWSTVSRSSHTVRQTTPSESQQCNTCCVNWRHERDLQDRIAKKIRRYGWIQHRVAQHTHGDGGITCCTEKQLSTVCLDRQRYWIDSFLSYRTREQTSKCFFPFSEIFSSQVLTRFVHSPSHVVRVLQLDLWHSLLRRFEYEVRARICLQRSFSVLHVNVTKKMRLFGLCRRVEPRSRITAGNDSLVDYNSWQRSSAQKWTRRWKITRVSFLHRLCVKTNRHMT